MEAAGVSVNGTHSHLQGGQSVSKTEKSGSRNTSLLFTDLETESKRNNEEGLAKGRGTRVGADRGAGLGACRLPCYVPERVDAGGHVYPRRG